MASKVILDSPALLEETLVTLTEACRCFPVRCSRSAVERWIRRGGRGAVLESVMLCGKRYTSKEAISRFLRAQLHVEDDRPEPKRGGKSRKEIEEASRRFGLPESQGTGNAENNSKRKR